MQKTVLILAALLATGALAGCASNSNHTTDNTTTSTPVTSTPMSSTPVTSTPGNTTMPGNDTMHEQCPPSMTSGAATSHLTVGVSEPTGDSHCFSFVGLHNVTAGLVNITFTNNGTMPHVLVVQRLTENHTFADAMQALMSQGENASTPSWVQDWGGVGIAGPGVSASVIQDMPAGTYLVFCWFAGHVGMGMVGEVDAVAGNSTVTAPTPDATATLTNFAFHVDNLTAGHHVIAVHNNGTQAHEFPLVHLANNTTIMQFAQALEDPNATGPPPGMPVGGVNAFQPGMTVYVEVDLVAGPYGTICFVTDPASGQPHALLGMHLDFTVQ